MAEHLDGRFRLFTPDLHGYGGTDAWPGERPLRLADEAALVAALIKRIGAPVHLVGHSYGGAVALRLAADYPERIARLTLIEPAAFHLLRTDGIRSQAMRREIARLAGDVAKAVARGDYHGGMGRFVNYWNGEGAWDAMPAEMRASLAPRLVKVASEFHAGFGETAGVEQYRNIRVPVALLRGRHSPQPVRRIAEILAVILSGGRLESLETAGHMMPITHPGLVADIVGSVPGAPAPTPIRAVA